MYYIFFEEENVKVEHFCTGLSKVRMEGTGQQCAGRAVQNGHLGPPISYCQCELHCFLFH